MMPRRPQLLCDPVLKARGIVHGFGVRGSQVPATTVFPRQVHGVEVVCAADWSDAAMPAADAILSTAGRLSVGIVTADCVPILVSTDDASHVLAIHAGWRGLAAGVIEAGLAALIDRAGRRSIVAAVGPAARGCCYEVDGPVRRALDSRYAKHLDAEILAPARSGHYRLDLPRLAGRVLGACGVEAERIGTAHRVCTICDPVRFESYRRDGVSAGRLRHFIAAAEPGMPQRG